MVEARPRAPLHAAKKVKGKASAVGAYKGKKGKKGDGMSESDALATFERDLARAIEESRVSAGLVNFLEDYIPNQDEEPQIGISL